jgi:hypothetical protein
LIGAVGCSAAAQPAAGAVRTMPPALVLGGCVSRA